MYMPQENEIVYIPDLQRIAIVYKVSFHAAIEFIHDNGTLGYSVREFWQIEYLWLGEGLHDCL